MPRGVAIESQPIWIRDVVNALVSRSAKVPALGDLRVAESLAVVPEEPFNIASQVRCCGELVSDDLGLVCDLFHPLGEFSVQLA